MGLYQDVTFGYKTEITVKISGKGNSEDDTFTTIVYSLLTLDLPLVINNNLVFHNTDTLTSVLYLDHSHITD